MSYTQPTDNLNGNGRRASVAIPMANNDMTQNGLAQEPDSELRSQINGALLQEGHVDRIHQELSHILSSDPSNFSTKIRQHALHLLRNDPECTTFPILMARVLADVRADTNAARREAENKRLTEEIGEEWQGNGLDRNDWRSLRENGSLELPQGVVEEGVRLTREALEQVVELGVSND